MVQMDHIINAIHPPVPEELWPEILRKIDGPRRSRHTGSDEFEVGDHGEDEFDAVEPAMADQDCWTPYARRALAPSTCSSRLLRHPFPIGLHRWFCLAQGLWG